MSKSHARRFRLVGRVVLEFQVLSGFRQWRFRREAPQRKASASNRMAARSLLFARGIGELIRSAGVGIDDLQFVLVLWMPLNPGGGKSHRLPFRLKISGLRIRKRRETIVLDVLSPVRLPSAFHEIVPIDIFRRIAQFRSGRHFDIICLSGNQRVASYKDRECDRHQEWTDCCGPVPLHHAVPHSGSRRIVSFNEKPVEVPATGSALAKQRGVGLAFLHARR